MENWEKQLTKVTKKSLYSFENISVALHWQHTNMPTIENIRHKDLKDFIAEKIKEHGPNGVKKEKLRLIKIGTVDIYRPPA